MAKFGRRNPNNANSDRDKRRSLQKEAKIRFEETKHRQQVHNSQYLKVDWSHRIEDDEDEYND